jgi:hypothetical protein
MDQFQLDIAELHIVINSSQFPILHEDEHAYDSFLVVGNRLLVEPDIKVELQRQAPPDVNGWVKIFEDEDCWSVYQFGEEYLLHYKPSMHGDDPLWVARYQKDCSQVVVYCSEKFIRQQDGRSSLINPVRYPLDQHLIMYRLSQTGGALIHAAGWIMDEKGFLFLGRSGAGKSTLSRLFSGNRNWVGLSDDRILVRRMMQGIQCYGTPWPGEEGLAVNAGANLSGIIFLRHDKSDRITPLNPGEALKRLLPVVSIPWYDQETCMSIMQFCEDLLSHIPAFELCFKPTVEVVDLFEDFVVAELGLEVLNI